MFDPVAEIIRPGSRWVAHFESFGCITRPVPLRYQWAVGMGSASFFMRTVLVGTLGALPVHLDGLPLRERTYSIFEDHLDAYFPGRPQFSPATKHLFAALLE